MGTLSFRYTEPLITRFGARKALLSGLVLVVAGLALFTQAPVDGGYVAHVLPPLVLLGIGIGVSFPSLMSIAMSGATRQDAGLASGLVNTTAQVGGALGLAVLATLSTTRSNNLIAEGQSTAAALTSGYHLAFLIGAILVAAAFVVGIAVLQPEERAAAAAGGSAEEGEPAYSEVS
jgi:MFS family permease